jgi:uncharacterized integral membrane protein
MKPQTIILLIIGVLITILIIQNTHSVVLKIYFWQPEIPLVILIAIALVAGFLAGYLARNLAGAVSKKKDEY